LNTAATLGVAAGIALAGWLVLLALFAVATRARHPDAAPATMDFPDDEPPAVVNLLTNGWAVGKEAVPATLIDLAARKVLAIEEVGPERFIVRVPPDRPASLEPYEEQVLQHVRSLASGGVVPCEALTTGPEADSQRWWKQFRKAVIDDARARGLSRSRWSGPYRAILSAAAAVPAGLATAALVASDIHSKASSSSSHDDPFGWLGASLIIWAALSAVPTLLRADRDTPAGLQAASRWLGVREHLHADEHFAEQPPAAVAIWDRYLSYGAAMGVAAGAVRALPMGSESERQAWSSYGGRWHMVRIHYPQRFPPGWGRNPWAAIGLGLAWLVPAAFVTYIMWSLISHATDDLGHVSRGGAAALGALVAVVISAVPLAALAYGTTMLWSGVTDVGKRSDVEGRVLRRKEVTTSNDSGTHTVAIYLAVDDGRHPELRALRCSPQVADGVHPGAEVRATVSPHLAHVYTLDRLAPIVSTQTGS
jgi:hypothetical protein